MAAVLIWYGCFTFSRSGAWAGGSDSSGYLNGARLIRAGTLRAQQRAVEGAPAGSLSPMAYVPLGFIPSGPDQMVPTYPLGLPLLFAGGSFLGWSRGTHWVVWLHLAAAVLLLRWLGGLFGLEPAWAWAGALLLAASPLFLFISLQPLSDTPAMVWCMASIGLAWRSRRQPPLAIAAGLACALALLIRPTDLLLAPALAAALGRGPRRWLGLLLGLLPGAVFLALANRALYGHALATGYVQLENRFSWAFVAPSGGNYLRWLPVALTPAVLLVPAAALLPGRPLLRPPARVLALWASAFLGFYLFYYYTHETWWYLRFLLPAFPPLILAAMGVLRWLGRRVSPAPRIRLGAVAILLAAGWACYWCRRLDAVSVGGNERTYPDVARWVSAHVPADAVLIGMQESGAILYYTPLPMVRWDQASPADLERIGTACAAAHRPLFAVLFPFEEKEALAKVPAWKWRPFGSVRGVGIWQLVR